MNEGTVQPSPSPSPATRIKNFPPTRVEMKFTRGRKFFSLLKNTPGTTSEGEYPRDFYLNFIRDFSISTARLVERGLGKESPTFRLLSHAWTLGL